MIRAAIATMRNNTGFCINFTKSIYPARKNTRVRKRHSCGACDSFTEIIRTEKKLEKVNEELNTRTDYESDSYLKVIEEKVGCAPLLLLDDVSSELDKTRTEYLFKSIEELGCQVWISTTGSVDLKIPKENHHFNIINGALNEVQDLDIEEQ